MPFDSRFILLAVAIAVNALPESRAQEQPTAAQTEFFEKNIRPAFVKYCYECHSVEKGESRGGLVLDFREGVRQGGDSGPALVPGQPETSLLWEAINWDSYEMPPSQKMPDSVIADFKTWISMGAPDPRERKLLHHKSKISATDIQDGQEHWALQPPRSQQGATIDGFVSARLQEAGMKASDPADAFTLLRRINFDLIGLPPTPAEITAFANAFKRNADTAVKAKIDELLGRPQYGERWGRHWLDVARYAESSGSRNTPYPHAWRYRNYVVDSFNDDTPYDRFIAEQIAGDLLPVKTDEQWQKNLIATGFLAIGLKHHDEKNPRKFESDMVDEQIDTLTQAVLGLTVACARCHDHKYDPIPTADYYAMAGIFQSTQTYYGTTRIAQNHRPSELLLLPIADNATGSAASSKQAMSRLKGQIAKLDRDAAGLRGKERREIRNVRNRLEAQLTALNPDGTPKTFGMGVQDAEQMTNAHILISGEVEKPAQEVPRGFVQVLGDLNFTVRSSKSSGRLELVDALISKENPLTARVMANRIWMHLLGKPIVGTPSNFGFSGAEPDNQELLDHLAVSFMNGNWSIKELIREIVMSETYRRSSRYIEANYAVDPDNVFLWRANPRQIDAEAMRDAMLALSGQLNLERPVPSPSTGRGPASRRESTDDSHRSVYLPIVRDAVPDSLDLFDFPDPNTSSSGRSESIVPTQALYMMNGDFVTTQARAMAGSLASRYGTSSEQVSAAFLWAYGRPPTNEEIKASQQFFRDFNPGETASTEPSTSSPGTRSETQRRNGRGRGRRQPEGAAAGAGANTKPDALAVFCQTLMASAAFRILN